MISAPNLKSLTGFLSSIEGISAVYDKKSQLLWTNCEEFFGSFDIHKLKLVTLTEEVHYRTSYLGDNAVMTVTPIYRSVRTVSVYAVTVKSTYQVFKMMSCTSVADHITMLLEDYQKKSAELMELNKKIALLSKGGRVEELIDNQSRILNSINTDMGCFAATVFPNLNPVTVNCNLTLLIESICNDADACLKDIKRRLTTELEDKRGYLKIDSSLLSAAIAALLNCHLSLSPLKSGINIRTSCSDDKIFNISIRSRSGREGITEKETMYCNFRRDLAEKIIRKDCGGEFSFSNDGKNAVSKISFFVSLKNRGSMLTSKNSPYLNPEHKPVRNLLRKTMETEIEALEEMKMEASKKKRLDNID